MHYLGIFPLFIGIFLLVVGYRKNQRNLLLLAAVLLFASGATGNFITDFISGYKDARNERSVAVSLQQPNNSFKPMPLRGTA